MPALERSAAALEPCSFGKALSAVRSSRKLHTAFWQHGATEAELSLACQALAADSPRGDATPSAAADSAARARRLPPLMASVFLFDFLYPQGARSLLQRSMSGPLAAALDRRELPRASSPVAKSAARTYSSDAAPGTKARDKSAQDHGGEEAALSEDAKQDPAAPELPMNVTFPLLALKKVIKGQRPIQVYEREMILAEIEEKELGVSVGALRTELRGNGQRSRPRPVKIDDSMGAKSIEAFEQLWEDYVALPEDQKPARRPDLIAALGKSRRLTEAWHISEAFHEMPEEAWTADAVAALVRSEVSLQNTPEAVRVFKAWLARGNPPVGFGALAAKFLSMSSWSGLEDICAACLDATAPQAPETPAVDRPSAEESPVDQITAAFLGKMDGDSAGSSDAEPSTARDDIDEIGSEAQLKLGQAEIEEIGATPDLLDKLSQLYVYVHQGTGSARTKATLGPLLSGAVSWFLDRFKPETAMAVVKHYGNPLLYEQFIRLAVQRDQKALATYAYFLYRDLPNVKIRVPIMHLMIDGVFRPNGDVKRMETVLHDWRGRYDRLDVWGYKKYLSLYAMAGNIRSFDQMHKEFLGHYPREAASALPYLLRINGVLGRTDAVERIIKSIGKRYNMKPTTTHFNILLSSYAKKSDVRAAARVFANLCEVATPNEQSFSAMMGVLGRSGDLDFLQRLEQMAKSRGVEITPEMRAHLVNAYCYNGAFAEALEQCTTITKAAGSRVSAKKATEIRHMWHVLLVHYGKKRDLKAVHRTLKLMTGFGVQFDQWTYSHLLMALAYCRQAHHALHLFRAGVVEGFLRPSAKHFLTLMIAFLESGEPHMVMRIDQLMDRLDLPITADRALRKILARLQWDRQPPGRQQKPDPDENFADSLADLLMVQQRRQPQTSFGADDGPGDRDLSALSEIHDDLLAAALLFAVKQRKDGAVRKLLEVLNKNVARDAEGRSRGAVRIMEAVMRHELGQGNLDNVRATWETLLDTACNLGRPISSLGQLKRTVHAEGQGEEQARILPAARYLVTGGFNTMLEMLKGTGDGEGIMELLRLVLDKGFGLKGRSWNYYVQALATAGKVHEAFVVCEQILMPNWTGWYQTRLAAGEVDAKLPSDLRRMGTAPEHRRPTSFTIVELRLHYRDLLRRAPWSREVEAEVAKIERDAAATVKAIRTMRRAKDPRETAQRYGVDLPEESDLDDLEEPDEFELAVDSMNQGPGPEGKEQASGDAAGESSLDELLRLLSGAKKPPAG